MDDSSDSQTLEATPRLVSALRNLPKEQPFVPPTVDEAILKAARTHLDRPTRPSFVWFRPRMWAAAATLLAIIALAGYFWLQPRRQPRAFAREDINRDGTVDIIDALIFARAVQSGGASARLIDVNQDGVIDRADAAAVAACAVRLDKGGRS